MTERKIGVGLVIGGMIVNNYAYMHDIIYMGEELIWMGPYTGAMAVAGMAITLYGTYRLTRIGRS